MKRMISLGVDNQSSYIMATNPTFGRRTRHIELKWHYVREQVRKNELYMLKVKSENNPADLFTKQLAKTKFEAFSSRIGMRMRPPRNLLVLYILLKVEEAVISQHASPNTVFYCLYGFYFLGYSRKELARIYHKSIKTIGNWINVYEKTGTYQRAERESSHVFTKAHQTWLCQFYTEHPPAYVDEAQEAFSSTHHMSISKCPPVWRILHDCGYTRKVLERRAMHIKEKDVCSVPGRLDVY
ncbi:Hypothetical protein PHPALM_12831 [Phytophthora palmivora]|uniref:Uncharacterized protein n=1 Tax=Phytophthora palmivora TaxID=4796 RepID=A0A2P4XYR7_9STRA|nr:Hypothetical protein PHPALM_12831 [Phytophthora palmivora]